MRVTVEIELDETWDGYFRDTHLGNHPCLNDVAPELFLEDLFSNWDKDGIKNVELKEIRYEV